MSRLIEFLDTSKGHRARIWMDNGDTCSIVISQASVSIKKSKGGLFGSNLYDERSIYRTAKMAEALNLLYADNLTPAEMRNSVLKSFTNAVLHCHSSTEVITVLKQVSGSLPRETGDVSSLNNSEGTMQGNERSAPEFIRQLEEEKRALNQKLAETIQENETLHERLAELDIQLNIEKAEMRREIENLSTEKEDLLKENESLLGDLSSLDEKTRELSRSLEIKQLFFEDADKYLSDAKGQMEAWESKCKDLESRCDAMTKEIAALEEKRDERESEIRRLMEETEALKVTVGEKSKENLFLRERIFDLDSGMKTVQAEMEERLRSETEKLLASTHEEGDRYQLEMEALKNERESALRQKDEEIEALTEEIRRLRRENENIVLRTREIEKDLLEMREKAVVLENSLSLRDAAVRELEGKVSEGAQHRQREREELSMKLEDAQRELASLGESRDSLAEALKEEREEVESLKGEMEKALAEMDGEIGNLKEDYDEKRRRLDEEKAVLEAGLRQVQEELSAALKSHADREASFRKAEERISELEDLLFQRDGSLSALEEQLRHAHEKASSLEQAVQEKDRALAAAEKRLSEADEGMISLREALSQGEATINELREKLALHTRDIDTVKGERDALSARLQEGESLKEEIREKNRELEYALSVREEVLRELEAKLSGVAEHGHREKEELYQKLEESRREILTLAEAHESLSETVRERDEENEILKSDMENALREKDNEIRALREEHDKKAGRLSDEKVSLEGQLKDACEKVLSLEQAVHEKELSSAAVEKELEEARDEVISARETLARTEITVSELRQEIASLSMDIDAKASLSERMAAAEAALEREIACRTENEDALALKEAAIRELKAYHESETERLGGEMKRLADDAARERTERERLEKEATRSGARITELEGNLSEHLQRIEHQKGAIERLRGETGRLENDLASLAESVREKESMAQALHLSELEAKKYAGKVKDLEASISGAAQRIAFLEELVAEKEAAVGKSEMILKKYESLAGEKESLAGRLSEALKEADALRDVRTLLSSEIGRLQEELRGLRDESETRHLTLRHDLEESFSKISESAGRLEHALSEGMNLVKGQGDALLGENFPVTLRQTSAQPGGTGRSLTRTAITVLVTLVIVAVGVVFFLGQGIHFPLKPEKADTIVSPPPPPPWAEGVKQTKSGGYGVTLIFLNREAVRALGLSEKITDAGMAENHYALIEIKSESGCLPDDFLSSFDKNVVFLDKNGATAPLNISEDLSGEKRVVYKSNVCGKKTGAVYMKAVGSVAKNFGIEGIHIIRLNKESPVVLR